MYDGDGLYKQVPPSHGISHAPSASQDGPRTLYSASEMLLSILLACLSPRSVKPGHAFSSPMLLACLMVRGVCTNLCWLANFRANGLPLVCFILFDSIEESLTLV